MYKKKAIALYNQGRELEQSGKLVAAEQIYKKAISAQPDFVEAYNNLGNTLVDMNKLLDARRVYRKAVNLEPDHPMLLSNMGNVLQLQGENDKAIKWLNKALAVDPDYADAYNNLGHALSDQGEIDQAVSAFQKSIRLNPENAIAYRDLAKNKKFLSADDDLISMENFYRRKDISSEQKMHLGFGLGKTYEDIGEYEKSFECILEANRLKRASINFDFAKEQDLFMHIKQVFSAEFMGKYANTGFPDISPIFILGMPRSGTSLVEQILASHHDVYGAGELTYIPDLFKNTSLSKQALSFPHVVSGWNSKKILKTGQGYVAGLRKYSELTKCVTNKLPHNFLYIGLIKLILPNAKIIHCNREPMDTCFSIFKNFFSHGHEYAYNLDELGRYYRLYEELMRHWAEVLPDAFYNLNYENLVSNQESGTRQLLDYCDLPWDINCLAFHKTKRNVKTASNAQVRQPIYDSSVKLWKRFEYQLEPLAKALREK